MFVLPVSRPAVLAHRIAVAPQLSSAVERLFDESLDRFFGGSRDAAASRTPAMDVSESDGAYTVVFDVPGVTREQLKVSVEGRRLSLSTEIAKPAATPTPGDAPSEGGDKPASGAAAAGRTLYRERPPALYARTVSLPAEVDPSASQARFDNGVLTLTLAKKVASGAAQLRIA